MIYVSRFNGLHSSTETDNLTYNIKVCSIDSFSYTIQEISLLSNHFNEEIGTKSMHFTACDQIMLIM